MNPDEIIRLFDQLPTKAWPPNSQQVIIDGDDWTGQLVVRVSDVLKVVGLLVLETQMRGRVH